MRKGICVKKIRKILYFNRLTDKVIDLTPDQKLLYSLGSLPEVGHIEDKLIETILGHFEFNSRTDCDEIFWKIVHERATTEEVCNDLITFNFYEIK